MLKTNTVNTIALLTICISFWNALYFDKTEEKNNNNDSRINDSEN